MASSEETGGGAVGARHRPGSGPHHGFDAPSAWVLRFAGLIPAGGPVLDLAAGGGRHSRHLLELGYRVTACDLSIEKLADLAGRAEVVQADLESGAPFPFADRQFAGLVVTNYLHRPLFPDLLACLAPGGILIYETFARGNERFGKPANPKHLLAPGELLNLVQGCCRVLAYEDLIVERPRPAAVQRICARKDG